MSDMRCANCGLYGIRWTGWRLDNFTHTKCPHCGGINCQEPMPEDDGDSDNDD